MLKQNTLALRPGGFTLSCRGEVFLRSRTFTPVSHLSLYQSISAIPASTKVVNYTIKFFIDASNYTFNKKILQSGKTLLRLHKFKLQLY